MSDMFNSDRLLIETPSFTLDSYGKKVPFWKIFAVVDGSIQLKRGEKSVVNGLNKYRCSHRFYSDAIPGFSDDKRCYAVKDCYLDLSGQNEIKGDFPDEVVILDETDERLLVLNTDFALIEKNEGLSQKFDRDIYNYITIINPDLTDHVLTAQYRNYIERFKVIAFNVIAGDRQETDLTNEY